MTQTTTRSIPATTDERCARYGATQYACTCPDATTRKGGSYLIPGKGRHCKHSAHLIAQAEATYAARAERAINNLFHPEPKRLPALVDDGLSGFFGSQRLVPAPQPAKSETDDLFACFELV